MMIMIMMSFFLVLVVPGSSINLPMFDYPLVTANPSSHLDDDVEEWEELVEMAAEQYLK